jgi:hypothetical protein
MEIPDNILKLMAEGKKLEDELNKVENELYKELDELLRGKSDYDMDSMVKELDRIMTSIEP